LQIASIHTIGNGSRTQHFFGEDIVKLPRNGKRVQVGQVILRYRTKRVFLLLRTFAY